MFECNSIQEQSVAWKMANAMLTRWSTAASETSPVQDICVAIAVHHAAPCGARAGPDVFNILDGLQITASSFS